MSSTSPLRISRVAVDGQREEGRHSASSSMVPHRTSTVSAERRGTEGEAEPHEEPPVESTAQPQAIQVQTRRRRAPQIYVLWQAWFAPSSVCYHKKRSCRGLGNAGRIQGIELRRSCQFNTQGQQSYDETSVLYIDEVDRIHTDVRCGAVVGGMLEKRACKLCALNFEFWRGVKETGRSARTGCTKREVYTLNAAG